MARIVFLTGLCLLYATTFAQVADTTYLDEVRVYGIPFTSFSTGSKIEQIKTGESVETLSDKLIDETSLYLKTYGNSQLSSITMRGTTASQTAVLWNGININSPTLGQTDFSLIPLFLMDEISIRYGTASALYGTDAIGGSIMLGQSPARFNTGVNATLFQEAGSFGKWNMGVKTTYGNNRWEFRTKLYRASIENNFPYTSKAVGYSKEQNHAAVLNYGFNQQVHFKISQTQQISLDGMYTYNFREIQPAVTNDQGNETLRDKDLRLGLKYQNNSRLGIVSITTAYANSDQDYYDDATSNTTSQQLTTLATMDVSVGQRTAFRYGGSFSHFAASSENFANDVTDNRGDVFASVKQMIHTNWIINLNVRQSFYNGEHAPFAPTLGTEVYVVNTASNKLTVRGQAARGFRVPTLNDRYWLTGDVPSVKPEDAITVEGGVQWFRSKGTWQHTVDLGMYRTWADQMIVWRMNDDDVWVPSNLQKVNIHGIELNAKATLAASAYVFKGNVIYSYTRSINQKGLNELDQSIVDKQLAYVPVHSGRVSFSVIRDLWRFDSRLNITGLRYTQLDNQESLDPYGLLDASIGKTIQSRKFSISINAEVNNILDAYYENLKNRAMPGRNYSLSLLLNFNDQ